MKKLNLRICTRAVCFLMAYTAVLPLARAQGLEYIKANYTKYEYKIPMRDGIKLFTAVYVPKDSSQQYPMLVIRTPYGVAPYGADNYKTSLGPAEKFAKESFIFVYQDVRGQWMSEGEFVNVRPYIPAKKGTQDVDESSDTYDTIDWLIKKVPNNNGRAGIWGVSYPGFYAAMGCIDAHPALKACSPQAPISDWFIGDDFHHNGVLYLAHAFNFFSRFGRARPEPATIPEPPFEHATPDGYNFFLKLGPLSNVDLKHFKDKISFWHDLMQHGTYDDFWKARNIRPHLKNIRPAVLTVGGWFDAEDLFGPLKVYESIERSGSGNTNLLVMGPWYHGGWGGTDGDAIGNLNFGSKTGVFFRDNIEFQFFNHYLKGGDELKLPEAYVFETGRNQWRQHDSWPPLNLASRLLYLHPNGKLSFDPPAEDSASAFDEYVSDPAKPVPYIANIDIGMTREHMLDDQRFASSRTDVLVYQSDELEEDVTLAGPITPSLFVSTTGTDSD